jgi:hypothetical protein
MTEILLFILLPSVAALSLWLFVRHKLRLNRERQISRNEYDTAVSLWTFAKALRTEMDQMAGGDVTILDFTKIQIPNGAGYTISLELSAQGFTLHALPKKYSKTGMVSFYTDRTLTVRALDHAGAPGSVEDPEYMSD